jgi:hypothetical protein
VSLLLLMLLVSWTSLILQSFAFVHLLGRRSTYDAEKVVGRGYVRTAACRVLAASVYVTVALLQLAGVTAHGLTRETVVIFTFIQILWLTNACADISIRRKLTEREQS